MELRQSIQNLSDVSVTLSKHVLLNKANTSNSVFSPLSLQVVLGAIAAGSKGATLDQLLSFLKTKSTDHLSSFSSETIPRVLADGNSKGGPRLSFANSIWVEKTLPLKHSFKQVCDNVYKAASSNVDFQNKAVEVADEVNAWAEKETDGLVKELLPPGSVDSTTKIIFANALYFKGAWTEKFDASATKDHDFHLLNGSSVRVPFMTSEKKQYVGAFEGFKVLCLPYSSGEDEREFSFCIYLPDAKDGLPALVEKVSSESGFLDRHLPWNRVNLGEFRIPRFKICFDFEASETLKGLGVTLPFSGGDLSEMVESPIGDGLFVAGIFHKAFVEVNEEGTEAAAATAAVIGFGCAFGGFNERIDFVADHPFLFAIRENTTGLVLFTGLLTDPSLAK